MSLSSISIRNPVFAWMLMASLIIFGGISFSRMGVSQLPDVDFPVVSVNLSLEGAAPEVMELDVVDPVEDVLMGIQGIKSISSSSKTGTATVNVEFGLEKNIDTAMQEIQNAISQVVRRLPSGIDPPSVSKSNPEDQPILWMAVSSDKMSLSDLMQFVRDRVKDHFSTISGVGEIFLGGYVDPSLRVWLSSKDLNSYALAVTDVLNTIKDEHAELPSGRIETPKEEFNIRTLGEAPTAEEFGKITINRRGGTPNFVPIRLNQVSQVEEGLSDIRRKSRSNGKPAVGLGIRKQRGANAVSVAQAVKRTLAEIRKDLPEGVDIGVRFDSTQFIEESIHELNFTLVLSAILTALVCFVFLGSWSAMLNVSLAIPTSIIGSFMILSAFGFTLNTFTLLGLSLAIGIVVDDAIMVLENMTRHQEMGKSALQAALDGSKEITFAAIAATIAIIAIFLPVAFMQGVMGRFFFQFGVTLSVAVAISLLEALTLAPMRASRITVGVGQGTTRFSQAVDECLGWMTSRYKDLLERVLKRPGLTIFGSALFFVGTFYPVKLLKKEFVPAQDQGRLMVRIQTAPGSSLPFTDERLMQVEQYFMNRPEIDQYFASIGGMGGGGGGVNTGMVFITLKTKKQRGTNPQTGSSWTQQELQSVYREDLKKLGGMKIVIQDPSLSSFSAKRGFPVEFTIRGPDYDTLISSSEKLMDEIKKTEVMTDIDSDYQAGMPEIQVIPDRWKAQLRGVSVYDIGQTINATMGGVIAGKYAKGGHRYDVRVRLREEDRARPEDIALIKVRNNRGELISLSDVVTIRERKTVQAIARQDRERAISVFANISPGHSQAEALNIVKDLAPKVLPEGYRAVVTGSALTFQESFRSLIFALVLGIVVAYMVLGSQFNSFLHPFIVLLALPFSVSGAFVSLLLGGQSLNIYSMIGLILLMGIVKKNSILLVDFTNHVLREKKTSVNAALLEACPVRFRPIFMTSVSTIAGAIPAALAVGPGAESRVPMALAVIGGVFVSTVLTLFVIPCVYQVLNRKTV